MKNRGFIGLIFMIILGLAALKYFLDWDVFDAASSDQGKRTIDYVRQVVNVIWSVIEVPVTFIWNKLLWPLLSSAIQKIST